MRKPAEILRTSGGRLWRCATAQRNGGGPELRRTRPSQVAQRDAAARETEAALQTAVRASLSLPPAERPAAIGRHLLAQLEGAPVETAAPSTPLDFVADLAPLAGLLTRVLNSTKGAAKGFGR